MISRASLYSSNKSRAFSRLSRKVLHRSCQNRNLSGSAPKSAEVELTIDGRKVSIEAGSALIQACEKAGVNIPRFCYHEKLAVAGNCRMCLVDLPRAPKPVASCSFPVAPGMEVRTDTPRVHKAREGVMEMLLANHPLDCPVCDQGGECDLQDQSMRYGSDRGRFHEIFGKRAVEDKDFGPFVKTSMNRCIQCTRCVRFATEVAGDESLGTTGRGSAMEIGMYREKPLETELSGNLIDLCPVGALTSKPTAFHSRPWELEKTESIDVLDAVGSNIRIDSRGVEVIRVQPRLHEDVNEEWINDKSRFAVDALKTQRLTNPLIKEGNRFVPATWDEALTAVGEAYASKGVKGDEFKAIAGQLADVEALVALKDLANRLGSENLAVDQPNGNLPLIHGVDFRSTYTFNSSIAGIDDATSILIIGSNPRHEAAVLNARLRKRWLEVDELEVGFVGESFNGTVGVTPLGEDAASLRKALDGAYGKRFAATERPLIIVGSAIAESPDAAAIYNIIGSFVLKNKSKFLTEEWNGYNVLQRAASRTGAYDVGFTTHNADVAKVKPKLVWLLGADEVTSKDLPEDAFVVYQGHHGDVGAQFADVILPAAAYTEKDATYVNTEGRAQVTRAAVAAPGAAREDWKIIRAASEYLLSPLPYDDIYGIRARLADIAPHLVEHDKVERTILPEVALKFALVDLLKGSKSTGSKLVNPIENFYFTDSISRNSSNMAKASARYMIKHT